MGANLSLLDDMTGALNVLRQALDCRDAMAIVAATRDLGLAVDAVRKQYGDGVDDVTRARLEEIVPMIESARVRVNIASDDVRKRISRLAQQGVDTAVATYGR